MPFDSLRAQGVRDICVVDPLEYRRQLALDLGATTAFDPVTQLQKKYDFVIDCAGTVELLDACVETGCSEWHCGPCGHSEIDFLKFNAHIEASEGNFYYQCPSL